MSGIASNLQSIHARLVAAAERSGRDAAEIKLIAVSKTHPPDVIREAVTAGVSAFGENKVQEAEGKILAIGRNTVEWHLIGHLQSNKARKAVQLFDVIHSVDSKNLAQRLERTCVEDGRESLAVLIQVDLAGEEAKAGIAESDLPALIDYMKTCERLKLTGLMILPPFFDNPETTRPYFKRLREIRDELLPGGELSMGMSNDFEVAIEEGATMVRVGTAIFGGRG
ncbi:MAG: YggS family pyridoxal phosphate-dependent enzyme [Pyrinomonadaceae bacterium]